MKTSYIFALTALFVLGVTGAFAAQTVCGTVSPDVDAKATCPECPVTPSTSGAGPAMLTPDPATMCGAFCEAGQAPAGWPFDWTDHYWLQPDSNL